MGRTMIAALISMGMLSGCTDWREGSESVETCLARFAPKKGAGDPLEVDRNNWAPSYTYDVTKMGAENLRGLLKASEKNGQVAGIGIIGGGSSTRKAFDDAPATEAGVLLFAEDPALFKVRGKAGLHRDLIRQGCEGQRAGMRLISWSAARADLMVDDKLPAGPTAAEIRAVQDLDRPKIKDLIP